MLSEKIWVRDLGYENLPVIFVINKEDVFLFGLKECVQEITKIKSIEEWKEEEPNIYFLMMSLDNSSLELSNIKNEGEINKEEIKEEIQNFRIFAQTSLNWDDFQGFSFELIMKINFRGIIGQNMVMDLTDDEIRVISSE